MEEELETLKSENAYLRTEVENLKEKLKWKEDLLVQPFLATKTYDNNDKYVGKLFNNN